MSTRSSLTRSLFAIALSALAGCTTPNTHVPCPKVAVTERACTITDSTNAPDSLSSVECKADFEAMASTPLDATLPGARSVKVVYDTTTGTLYFQNSVRFQIHYRFASSHLSGNGMPVVPSLSEFNQTEYFSPSRRFLLGSVTHYEQPDIWSLEIAPYDTMSSTNMTTLFNAVREHAYFGPTLTFHPTSDSVTTESNALQSPICVSSTDDIYAGTDYQPLTLGTTFGRVRFLTAAALANTQVSYDDIVVMDEAPNDISVVRALITQTFQTPLSHVNVLSQNRHTPNMGLRGAMSNQQLRALDGKLIELKVGALEWTAREATSAEVDAWWSANRPTPVTLPALALDVTAIVNAESATPEPSGTQTLRDVIREAARSYGGKCAHYSILARTDGVPIKHAFCVPVYYYEQFMQQNGIFDRVAALIADESFRTNAAVRQAKLNELQTVILQGTFDQGFQDLLRAKINADFPGATAIRFRTSTNSEDLDGFPCAGCYDSHTGNPQEWNNLLYAIKRTYASTWSYRTFEERSYYGVEHRSVGMALLVHTNFPDEEANGVAVTSNIFDASGLDPAFYVNVQAGGDIEVVAPPPGTTSDQFLYYFTQPGQPITYIARSNQIPSGQTVLTATQIRTLGQALSAIHTRFSPAYGPAAGNTGWYAMDVEFKFDDEGRGGEPQLFIKQARPYPGRGTE